MKILSLFDGMSVAQQAFKELNIPVEYYASEIDKYAIAVTQSNFPNTIQLGDVCKLGKEIPYPKELLNGGCDLIIFGSPCTDLSIAKKNREGLKGKQSGLFFEAVRIIEDIKPKFFVMENVNSMPKEAKQQISEILGVEPVMINASLVSAQNRKRLFWAGKWIDRKYEQVEIPQPKDKGILLKDILEKEVDEKYYILNKNGTEKIKSNTIRNGGRGSGINDKHNWDTIRIGQLNKGGQGDRIYSQEGKSTALSANGGGRGAKTGLYCISSTQKHATITINKSSPIPAAMGMGGGHTPMIGGNKTQIRKLTPTECLRLQSMPDDYFDKAIANKKPISNTQRYKMAGNAFNCEVIKHILSNIKK